MVKASRPSLFYLFGSPYFILNVACILAYPLCRICGMEQRAIKAIDESVSQKSSSFQFFGREREWSIASLLCFYLASKFYHSWTFEHFLSFLFLYSKLTLTCLFFTANHRYCVFYIVICFICWLFLEHPKLPKGISSLKSVKHLSEI